LAHSVLYIILYRKVESLCVANAVCGSSSDFNDLNCSLQSVALLSAQLMYWHQSMMKRM